jgi:hypothetical protein
MNDEIDAELAQSQVKSPANAQKRSFTEGNYIFREGETGRNFSNLSRPI